MANRRLLFAGTLATALTLRYLWPHSVADADRLIAKVEPRRDPGVLREVLREVRHVEVADEDEDDAGDLVIGEHEAEQAPGPKLDADGLTEDERFESDAAVVEDSLPKDRGAVMGIAKDAATGEPLAGATVVVTSRSLDGAQAAITDERGEYTISGLPAGDYQVTFYYADTTTERGGVQVAEGKTTPAFQSIQTRPYSGETIVIDDVAPVIDEGSTSIGITIDNNYIKNIPVPGRTFEAALGAAAGSQSDPPNDDDDIGVSFSGGTSLENTYYIDGDLYDDAEVID